MMAGMDEPAITVIHEAAKETRQRRIAEGLCATCGTNPLKTKYACEACAARQAAYAREHRAKQREQFLAEHGGMDGRQIRAVLSPEPSVKRCRACSAYLPLDSFSIHDKKTGRHATICKECDKKRADAWSKAHPERRAVVYRTRHLKRTYGISDTDYATLLNEQGGKCAICGVPEQETTIKRLCVDHCHSTRRIRGLLCTKCNQAIGLLDHDLDTLARAAKYLRPK